MNPKHYLAICLALLFVPMHSHALTQITLEWRPNTEPNLSEYKAFCRREGDVYDYTEPQWEGTEASCVIEIPDDDEPYYFVVRACSMEGSDSLDSNEVCFGCTAEEVDPEERFDDGDIESGEDTEDPSDGGDIESGEDTEDPSDGGGIESGEGTDDPSDGGGIQSGVNTGDLYDDFDNETSSNSGCFMRSLYP